MFFRVHLILTIVLIIFANVIYAKPKFEISGDVDYRIRYNYLIERDFANNDSSSTPDFQNRYAWNFRAKIIPFESMIFGFRVSNPAGEFGDRVSNNIQEKNLLSLPEAYMLWLPNNKFSSYVGIIPVEGNTILDLAANSEKGYKGIVADSTWEELRNNSLIGINLIYNILNNEVATLSVSLISAMAEDAEGTNAYDAFLKDKFEFIFSAPLEFKKSSLSFLPVAHFLLNNYRSNDAKSGSHTVESGLDIGWEASKRVHLKLGIAGGLFNNEALKNDTGFVASAPLGVLYKTELIIVPNYGELITEFRFGRYRDRKSINITNNDLIYFDLKYKMPVKKLSFIPRMRFWYYRNDKSAQTTIQLRPELILKASF